MSSYKVVIFEREYKSQLEQDINQFLSNIGEDRFVDVKYSGSGAMPPYGASFYSAMIIYK